MFGKKKKQQKQIPLDVNNSVPYSQIRPPVHSPGQTPATFNSGYHGNAQYGQQHQQSFSHSYYQDTHYPQQYGQRPQSPGSNNQQYFSDNSGHQTHSRSQSQEHSPQSSYSFQDSASSITRYSSENSSIRSSGAFSSDIQNWVGSVFGGNKEPAKPSDAEIENLFLDLMNKRDLKVSQRKEMLAFPTEKKWLLVKK